MEIDVHFFRFEKVSIDHILRRPVEISAYWALATGSHIG